MTDLLEGLNDASGVVWVDFARSLNVWADPPTPGWGYGYGPGWRNLTRTRTLLYPAATGTRVRQPVTIPRAWGSGSSFGRPWPSNTRPCPALHNTSLEQLAVLKLV